MCKEEGPADIRDPVNRKISTNEEKRSLEGLESERQNPWMKAEAAVMKVTAMVWFGLVLSVTDGCGGEKGYFIERFGGCLRGI